MKVHVFYTWILANCLHPVMFVIYELASSQGGLPAYDELSWAIFLFVLAFFVSLPCLMICWFVMGRILRCSASIMERFCMWLIAALLIVLLHAGLVMLLSKGPDPGILFAFGPALAAVFSSIVIRHEQFVILAAGYNRGVDHDKIIEE